MLFVGIDLAWSPRHRSGGVTLAEDGRLVEATSELGGDDEVLDFVVRATEGHSTICVGES